MAVERKPPTVITDLPEAVLADILSRVSTKEYVRTNILSKHWETPWTMVSVLDFDDGVKEEEEFTSKKTEPNKMSFRQFVYSVLLRHKTVEIKRFRLQCSRDNYSAGDTTLWVGHAICREVKEVELSLAGCTSVIPRKLMLCNSITVLKLNRLSLSQLGSSLVRLPVLKVLHLGYDTDFESHSYMVKLLRGCPLLEELVLESRYDCCDDTDCIHEEVKVEFNHLLRAKLNFEWDETCSMLRIFSAFRDVQSLSISSSLAKCLVYDSLKSFPAMFNNLVYLEISFQHYLWDLLVALLLRSPKLETLLIHKEPSDSAAEGEGTQWQPPPYITLNLKTLSLGDYEGYDAEWYFLEYVMENAIMLEKATISFSGSLPSSLEKKVREHFSTKCKTCQIEYVKQSSLKRKIEEMC